MLDRFRAALLVALLGAFGLTATAQSQPPQNHTIQYDRFFVLYSQPVGNGVLSVVRDFMLPNQPCLYLFQSAYSAQMMPTPGGVC